MKSGLAIGFAAALAVALAIGANAAIWSGLNPALLEPLPYINYFSTHFAPPDHSQGGKGIEGLKEAAPASFPTASFSIWRRVSAEDSTDAEKLFSKSISRRADFNGSSNQLSLCNYFETMSNRCANIFARGNRMR